MATELGFCPENTRWWERTDSGDRGTSGEADLQGHPHRREALSKGHFEVLQAIEEMGDRETTVRRITAFLLRRKRLLETDAPQLRQRVEKMIRDLHAHGRVREYLGAYRLVKLVA